MMLHLKVGMRRKNVKQAPETVTYGRIAVA
jgi:hypothetical protein